MQKTPGAAAWMIVGWNDCGREEARRQRIALNCAGELRAEELRGAHRRASKTLCAILPESPKLP